MSEWCVCILIIYSDSDSLFLVMHSTFVVAHVTHYTEVSSEVICSLCDIVNCSCGVSCLFVCRLHYDYVCAINALFYYCY